MNIDKLDKYVKENFQVSLMNDTKWEKLITCVTDISDEVYVDGFISHLYSVGVGVGVVFIATLAAKILSFVGYSEVVSGTLLTVFGAALSASVYRYVFYVRTKCT